MYFARIWLNLDTEGREPQVIRPAFRLSQDSRAGKAKFLVLAYGKMILDFCTKKRPYPAYAKETSYYNFGRLLKKWFDGKWCIKNTICCPPVKKMCRCANVPMCRCAELQNSHQTSIRLLQ
jgi:hypothetical protein